MSEKILCVDDERSILDGFQRQLRKKFDLVTRASGEEGLKVLAAEGPFAVVVSDMRMPMMDGIKFLAAVRERSPDSVRIMLTGMSDQQTAVDAVNEGNIFRFLSKPCSPEALVKALEAGVEQYRLVTAERELLEKTLKGSVKVLVDLLSLTNPVAFSRAMRLRAYAAQVAKTLAIAHTWQIEVAALLSQTGCVTIPVEVLEKYYAGQVLTDVEKGMIDSFPEVGAKLLASIPRLEPVARMVALQGQPLIPFAAEDPLGAGGHILLLVSEFDLLVTRGATWLGAIQRLEEKGGKYDRTILDALRKIEPTHAAMAARAVKITELRNGMIMDEDLRTTKGYLLLPKGHEINDTIRQRLLNFQAQGMLGGAVRVLIPLQTVPQEP